MSPATASATITVANTNDSGAGSLRQAITDAAPGETILVPAGTYTLTSAQLSIAKSLTISGNAASDTIIRAGGAFRVFGISGATSNVTISGVTIRDGSLVTGSALGGGVMDQDATLTLQDDVVANNRAVADGSSGNPGGTALGGGVYIAGAGTFAIVNSSVSGNLASAVGGSGSHGGVVEGGGLFINVPFTMTSTTVDGNTSDGRGGQGPSNASQTGGVVQGGGVFSVVNSSPPPTPLRGNAIYENVADASAGPGGTNGGSAEGAGMYLVSNGGTVSIANTTFASNTSRSLGPTGAAEGGGLWMINNNITESIAVTSLTLSGNTVDGVGPSTDGGDLWLSANHSINFANTIVSAGVAPAGSENCHPGGLTSLGHNLDSLDQCDFHSAGDLVNTNPQLLALADNGRPTKTLALAPGSPAIDKGASLGLTSDQRGVMRPIDFPSIPDSTAPGSDGADIGAFELQPSNEITLGRLKRNRRKGTAILFVSVPLPDAGSLTLFGKGVKRQSKPVADTGLVKLKVVGKRKVRKALRRRGRRKVRIKVTYTPTGNSPHTASRTAKLIRKRAHRKPSHG